MRCEHCGKPLKIGDEYIKFEGERFCDDCYQGYSIELFFIGGEYLATDDEGVERYCSWDEEEE